METAENDNQETIRRLEALNFPGNPDFDPTIFLTWDTPNLNSRVRSGLRPYIDWAQNAVRYPTDVVMITHLILYFTTSVPSAIYLFRNFTYTHGFLHWMMSTYYVGSYTLIKHQHIHANGVLAKRFPYSWIDCLFPYITDPLMGHTWNSYYYHHVKHHHVEANGPEDLSSTIRYQRDDIWNLLHYIGRFYFLIWFDLPMYFFRKGKYSKAFKSFSWEAGSLVSIFLLALWQFGPTLFAFILPLMVVRFILMIGNWGQHAFVDEEDPESDFRSSITLIDVAVSTKMTLTNYSRTLIALQSNRFCFNDGYHTSHHLNPRRHWREHPVSFLKQKSRYAFERALVFRNIDYLMITYRLMIKDYNHLARCLVPIGNQIGMTMSEKARMLQQKTRRFTEEEIKKKFKTAGPWNM